MNLVIEAISDKGVVRTTNEDLVLVGNDTLRNTAKRYEFDFSTYEHPFIIAVADGLGGHKSGAVASEFVMHNMAKAVNQLPLNLTKNIVRSYFNATSKTIHDCILDEGNADENKKGMASTFSGALFYGNKIYLLHVGDTRIYHYNTHKNQLNRLSRDHSLQELNGNDGALKTAIVNAFGANKDIFIDFNEITHKLQDTDLLLICSDGLTKELPDEEIAKHLTLPNGYLKLAEEANRLGGNDNISLAVVRYMKYW